MVKVDKNVCLNAQINAWIQTVCKEIISYTDSWQCICAHKLNTIKNLYNDFIILQDVLLRWKLCFFTLLSGIWYYLQVTNIQHRQETTHNVRHHPVLSVGVYIPHRVFLTVYIPECSSVSDDGRQCIGWW